MELVTGIYGISQYTGKNILAYMIMADCKYPWVAEAWSIEEKYVAIGPNPARLANLCRGVELSSANCTNISRATEQTFLEW